MQKGSILVTLLIFVATGIIITSGAVTVSLINTQGTSQYATGESTLYVAESGIEEAMLRILRNPEYTTTGTTLTLGDGTVTIDVSGTTTKAVQSQASLGENTRAIRINGNWTSNYLGITDWEEIQ